MTIAVVIVAAGRGHRAGGGTPKQYVPLGGPCALRRAAERFLSVNAISALVPVIHPDDKELCATAFDGLGDSRVLCPVHGGETRALSVRNGLLALRGRLPEKVLIHDAARPFTPVKVIYDVIDALSHHDGACAALPVVDALWSAPEAEAKNPVDRSELWRAQTPQGFWFERILAAHQDHGGTGTDDVAVALEAGLTVRMVPGSENNYKITTAADLARARRDADKGL